MKRAMICTAVAAMTVGVLVALTPAASAGGVGQDGSGTTPASAAKSTGNVTSASTPTATAAQQQAVVNYWTPARMAAAKPLDATPVKAAPQNAPEEQSAPKGAPQKVSGTLGNMQAATGAPVLAPAARPLSGNQTYDPVPRPYYYLPNRLNGKVFFSENGGNYVCSGTLVNSNNKDMVDTAGHCVATGSGAWVTNWAFVPGYSSDYYGQAPYGVWPARTLTTRTEWFYYDNLKQDYGYGVVGVQYGTHIVNWLGGQGTLWNYPRSELVYEFGYPQAYPYNGYDQRLNVSYTFGADNPSSRAGSYTLEINSPQTGGTSGGGWITYLDSNGLGYVDSHSSYRYGNTPNNLWGPYYDSNLQSLYLFAQSL